MSAVEHEPAPARTRFAPGLALKINLVLGLLTLASLAMFLLQDIGSTRNSIREEMEGSNRVAAQLLSRVAEAQGRAGPSALARFLEETRRIRANEVMLYGAHGEVLYRSPPSSYKAGRDAPDWYAALVTPKLVATVIRLPAATLVVAPNPSRAVLDAWDDLSSFVVRQAALLALAYLLVSWLLRRWLAPFAQLRRALLDIGNGRHEARLPPLPGREPAELGRAFNRMAEAVEEGMRSRQQAAEAQARLAAQREFTQALRQRVEEERRAIARELHDEFGQSLTAIRSIAAALLQRPEIRGTSGEAAVKLLFDTAGGTFDAMHRLIPRLRPAPLDDAGLADAVRDLAESFGLAHPGLAVALDIAALPELDPELETAAYRIVQEALTNVARHAGARNVRLRLAMEDDCLCLSVADDGRGLGGPPHAAPSHGMRGMRERAEELGGTLDFTASASGGLDVAARLPAQKVAA